MNTGADQTPQRIASLLASGTEILYGLGLGERVVAVSHECDFPPEAAAKPRVTGTLIAHEAVSAAIDAEVKQMAAAGTAMYTIDQAALVKVAPDLIVTQSHCDVCAVRYDDVVALVRDHDALRATRIVDLNPMTLSGVMDDIRRVGAAAGAEAEADDFVAALDARISAVRSVTAQIPVERRPRVVCIEWIEPLMVAANWMPELVDQAGGRCDLTHAGQASGYTPWQAVLDFDPQRIVIMPCGFDLARAVAEWPVLADLEGWSDLSAVKTGEVYAVDGNAYFNRSGPRLVDSLEILAHLIHPDRCDPPATDGTTPFARLNVRNK